MLPILRRLSDQAASGNSMWSRHLEFANVMERLLVDTLSGRGPRLGKLYSVARVLYRACYEPRPGMPEEAQGRVMTDEPMTLLERQVNSIVSGLLTPTINPDCVCGHPAAHHDGFGCAEVEGPFVNRCGCENYVAKSTQGPVSDAD